MEARSGMAGRLSGKRRSRRHTEVACVGRTLLSAAFDFAFDFEQGRTATQKITSKAADKSVRPTHATSVCRRLRLFPDNLPAIPERASILRNDWLPAAERRRILHDGFLPACPCRPCADRWHATRERWWARAPTGRQF